MLRTISDVFRSLQDVLLFVDEGFVVSHRRLKDFGSLALGLKDFGLIRASRRSY